MTDREDLYQQAWKAYLGSPRPMSQTAFRVPGDGIRAAVDAVLDARPELTADGESLAQLVRDVRDGDGHTVQIDGVLIAPCDEHGRVEARHAQARPDWEVLREAADIMHPESHPTGLWTSEERALRDKAKSLEAEHQAAQEKAAAEAAREKLIEQAARVLIAQPSPSTYEALARALADAGLLSAPTTDGGAA